MRGLLLLCILAALAELSYSIVIALWWKVEIFGLVSPTLETKVAAAPPIIAKVTPPPQLFFLQVYGLAGLSSGIVLALVFFLNAAFFRKHNGLTLPFVASFISFLGVVAGGVVLAGGLVGYAKSGIDVTRVSTAAGASTGVGGCASLFGSATRNCGGHDLLCDMAIVTHCNEMSSKLFGTVVFTAAILVIRIGALIAYFGTACLGARKRSPSIVESSSIPPDFMKTEEEDEEIEEVQMIRRPAGGVPQMMPQMMPMATAPPQPMYISYHMAPTTQGAPPHPSSAAMPMARLVQQVNGAPYYSPYNAVPHTCHHTQGVYH